MKKRIPGYIGICLLILVILAGCSETQPSEQPIVKETESQNTITVAVDGSTFCLTQRSPLREISVKV